MIHLMVSLFLVLLTSLIPFSAIADSINVAVAANFTEAAKEIGKLYKQSTNHQVIFSFGSTGQLYTQITQGAPFDIFLAADQERPEKAVLEGYAVANSCFTYATGKIVLFSKDPLLITGQDTLTGESFTTIAIANPVTAPYGAAAVESLKALGIYKALLPKIVQGSNIAQTYQFVETGSAELGFIALSQIATNDRGSRWLIPENLYTPIAQNAVLLKTAAHNHAAHAFMDFLKGPEANAVKEKFGYGTGQ